MPGLSRRRFLMTGSAAVFLSAALDGAMARLAPTPRQTEGPFYPDVIPDDTDSDLVKIEGQVREVGGEVLHLSGRLLGSDGAPIAGALVEIWQCDVNGRYLHTSDRGARARDAAFQGYGRARSDADGRFRFRTIRPVAYPGRTPHIHLKAHHPGGRVLTTQLYIAGDERNQRDFIYRSLTADEQKSVTLALVKSDGDSWMAESVLVL